MEPLQPIPMFPPSLDFLNFVTIFRIVILTWNRYLQNKPEYPLKVPEFFL